MQVIWGRHEKEQMVPTPSQGCLMEDCLKGGRQGTATLVSEPAIGQRDSSVSFKNGFIFVEQVLN